ncbi:MAG: hypothetical protein EHM72_18570 [Calditrichaeota bacterium]|nr:MAG: hypothetical protein EHM72_18570 [Calditrichota bacterium]
MKRLFAFFLISLLSVRLLAQDDLLLSAGHARFNRFYSTGALNDGGFLLCVGDDSNNDWSSYLVSAQRFNNNGEPVGATFQVNSQNGRFGNFFPIVRCADSGFIVFWEVQSEAGAFQDIHGQRFNAAGEKVEEEFSAAGTAQRRAWSPFAFHLADGGFVLCWCADGAYCEIFAQRFDSNGAKMGAEFEVNTTREGHQTQPCGAAFEDGRFIIVWQSDHEGELFLFAQQYAKDGRRIGSEFPIKDADHPAEYVSHHYVAALKDGGFALCWTTNAAEGFAQCFNHSGQPRSNVFRIAPDSLRWIVSPTVTSLPDGHFFICYQAYPIKIVIYEKCHAYGQFYDVYGNCAGRTLTIDASTATYQLDPQSITLNDGSLFVYWTEIEWLDYPWSVWGRRFPPLKKHNLNQFSLLQPKFDETVKTTTPRLSWQAASRQVVTYPWEVSYTVQYDTLMSFATSKTRKAYNDTILTLFRLKPGKAVFWRVRAKNDDGDSLWSDVGAFYVSLNADTSGNVLDPGEEMDDGDGQDDPQEEIPAEFALYQNAPNPFNDWTLIAFDLPEEGEVRLTVYDIRGRETAVLANRLFPVGSHCEWWDATDESGQPIASGVYFYRLEYRDAAGARQIQIKKMSLVK